MPNENPQSFGGNKKAAYQGIRDGSLDCLKAVFYLAVAINYELKSENKRKINIERLQQLRKQEGKNIKFEKHPNLLPVRAVRITEYQHSRKPLLVAGCLCDTLKFAENTKNWYLRFKLGNNGEKYFYFVGGLL
ncbi:MAG: hypothetical protein KF862_27150 [Chitinophagaceae bacterium]|nr:hypothetical protein [Chitinophagaceae bacterium]